jgi:hypothetical protein
MAEFFSDYIWPLMIMVAESLLLLIVLLIAIAYVLHADRKNLGGRAAAARPERGRSLGAAAILRRPAEILSASSTSSPSRRSKCTA